MSNVSIQNNEKTSHINQNSKALIKCVKHKFLKSYTNSVKINLKWWTAIIQNSCHTKKGSWETNGWINYHLRL